MDAFPPGRKEMVLGRGNSAVKRRGCRGSRREKLTEPDPLLESRRRRVRPTWAVCALEVRMGRKGKNGARAAGRNWKKPVAGILLGAFSVLLLLGLSSYSPRSSAENWAGPVGHGLAGGLLEAAGIGGYAVALFLCAIGCALTAGWPRLSFARAGSWLLFSFCAMGILDLFVHARLQGHAPGGAVG